MREFFNVDCFETMKSMKDGSVKLIVTDPPYGIDFKGVTIFTTLFFNNAFTKYILKIGPDAYKQKFELKNLSDLGETTYQHSCDNAVNYFNMSDDAKKIHDEVTESTEE